MQSWPRLVVARASSLSAVILIGMVALTGCSKGGDQFSSQGVDDPIENFVLCPGEPQQIARFLVEYRDTVRYEPTQPANGAPTGEFYRFFVDEEPVEHERTTERMLLAGLVISVTGTTTGATGDCIEVEYENPAQE